MITVILETYDTMESLDLHHMILAKYRLPSIFSMDQVIICQQVRCYKNIWTRYLIKNAFFWQVLL